MEIDTAILILDILAAAGVGIISSGDRRRIERAIWLGGAIPIVIFALVMVKEIASNPTNPELTKIFLEQTLTVAAGAVGGAVSSMITSLITTYIKKIL